MEEVTESQKESFFGFCLKKGLILAIVHIVINALLYVFLPSKLAGFSYVFFIILFNIGYGIFSVLEWRKSVGGFIEFGQAFKIGFLVLIINGLLSSLIFPLIHSMVDNSYPEVYAQAQVDTSIYWAEKFGAPENQLEEMREKMDIDDLKKRYSFLGMLTGFGLAILFYAIGGLIIGLFTKKSEPII